MPRINPEDYDDLYDDDDFAVDPDFEEHRRSKLPPPRPPKQDRDWEESRKSLINRKLRRDHRD